MRLKDKVAIVTGAASGIGRSVAPVFAHKGCPDEVAFLFLKESGRAFSTGADLREALDAEARPENGVDWLPRRKAGQLRSRICEAIEQMQAVTIAQVHGAAVPARPLAQGGRFVYIAVYNPLSRLRRYPASWSPRRVFKSDTNNRNSALVEGGYRSMNKFIVWFLRMLGVSLCLLASACVFVNSSAISESTGSGSPVKAEYSDFGILHLSAPSDLTPAANAALVKQCQSGVLSNVQTELSVRDWFLIVQYYTVDATAVCK